MSHTTTVQTTLTDKEFIKGAVDLLKEMDSGFEVIETNSVRLFQGVYEVKNGIAVKLKGWRYPVLIDLDTGKLYYDNYNGNWGSPLELKMFQLAYQASALLKGLEEMYKKGDITRSEYLKAKRELVKQLKEKRELNIKAYKEGRTPTKEEEKIRLQISL